MAPKRGSGKNAGRRTAFANRTVVRVPGMEYSRLREAAQYAAGATCGQEEGVSAFDVEKWDSRFVAALLRIDLCLGTSFAMSERPVGELNALCASLHDSLVLVDQNFNPDEAGCNVA
jgi:hypothetical protein